MVLAAHWLPGHFGTREFPLPLFALKILGPATVIFLLGLIDDFFGVNAYVKFAVQAGAAVLYTATVLEYPACRFWRVILT